MSQPLRETRKAIVAYPAMTETNYQWIEELRKAHSHRQPYSVHLDLKRPCFIFHSDGKSIEKQKLIESIEENLHDFYAFDFKIRYSITIINSTHGYNIVFVPMEGLHNFCRLLGIIHLKVLQNQTEPHSHIVPHINIAWCDNLSETKKRMNQINQHEIEIKGRIEKLSIREWQRDGSIPVIHEFQFKS
jgi:hypothetical protein